MKNSQKKKGTGSFVRKKTLQATLKEVSQQMYARNKELIETNRTLTLLRTIDTLVLEQQSSLKVVCESIAVAIARATEYPFVGLFTRGAHDDDTLTLYGWSGKDSLDGKSGVELGHPVRLQADSWLVDRLEAQQIIAVDDTAIAQIAPMIGYSEEKLRQLLEQLPLKSLSLVKLTVRRRLVGILVAGFYSPADQIPPADTLLMERLSESIGVALDNKLLFEENRRVVRQLRESNAKLRTLDETKDDFISMASHQLRTPLTSVKGYLSMVLDGDAGKLTALERKMLTQAFISSQRMVYLISDLLNVSRLKTGKFIIERVPVNLADMISDEIAQLQETAKTRSLSLQYDKPKDFPAVALDETKTRQVVMNFIDNAIYYTPSGGHIRIELIDKPSSVELRVVDDGIGVPRAEQHHLFTKFYRAGNARKARPDGTGLGLFMAKKVVIAQGGAIIFETKEAVGSTFGFSFPKVADVPSGPTEVAVPVEAVAE